MIKLPFRIDLRCFARVVFPEQDAPLGLDAAEKRRISNTFYINGNEGVNWIPDAIRCKVIKSVSRKVNRRYKSNYPTPIRMTFFFGMSRWLSMFAFRTVYCSAQADDK